MIFNTKMFVTYFGQMFLCEFYFETVANTSIQGVKYNLLKRRGK